MSVRTAIIKKMENNRCWPAKRNSWALLVGMQMSTYTVGNNTKLLKFARSTSVMRLCHPINNGNLKDMSKGSCHPKVRTGLLTRTKIWISLSVQLPAQNGIPSMYPEISDTVYNVVSESGGCFVRWSRMTLKLPSKRSGKLVSFRE